MEIRKATEQEMLTLWGYPNVDEASHTAKFFSENLRKDNAEFWTVDDNRELIGELYIFKKLDDTDFADGHTRVYLCAFRIRKDHRGRGLGSRLVETVLAHIKKCGYDSVTIGVDETEDANIRLYKRFGFETKIKDCYIDPCDMDEGGKPKNCSCFWLLSRKL